MGPSTCSRDMLEYLGVQSVKELFNDIPNPVRTEGLRLPGGVSELELTRSLEAMLSRNRPASSMPTFLGGGVYHHFIPAAVKTIVGRSEFITSYTPYQAEISQGMLQALFEYQSFMVELTGMDVVNASMYDASSALGEAVLMSSRMCEGSRFLVSRAVSPERFRVASLYAKGADMSLEGVAYDPRTGTVDLEDLGSKIDDTVTGFYFETPNFLGPVETRFDEIREVLGNKAMVVGVNPLALAVLRPPGEFGADIVVGEAQVFGSPMNLGGPLIGLFGCRSEHARKMPGRIVGRTADVDGNSAYCMTLRTREQDIRRSKATSNICTNESLLAVAAAAHLALLGRSGLRRTAAANVAKMRSLAARIDSLDGFHAPRFASPHFNEFVVTSEAPSGTIHRGLLERGVHGGLVLDETFPELGHSSLYATTEMHTKEDHDRLIAALEAVR